MADAIAKFVREKHITQVIFGRSAVTFASRPLTASCANPLKWTCTSSRKRETDFRCQFGNRTVSDERSKAMLKNAPRQRFESWILQRHDYLTPQQTQQLLAQAAAG